MQYNTLFSPKVYRLEMTSDEADWDNQPWQSHESSPEAVEKVPLTEPSQSRPTIGNLLQFFYVCV